MPEVRVVEIGALRISCESVPPRCLETAFGRQRSVADVRDDGALGSPRRPTNTTNATTASPSIRFNSAPLPQANHVGHLRFILTVRLRRSSVQLENIPGYFAWSGWQSARLLQQSFIQPAILFVLFLRHRSRWICDRKQRAAIFGRQYVILRRLRSRIGCSCHDELPNEFLVCFRHWRLP